MKILNLYAGIGGNRKFWGDEHDITAVEFNEDIAAVYSHYFPNDIVVIGDAHQYLLDHYEEFDFIWSSRPCTSHSRARYWAFRNNRKVEKMYPDLGLYEEILFLKHFFDGLWIVENVVPYYTPLIEPSTHIGRHLFWSNFDIPEKEIVDLRVNREKNIEYIRSIGLDLSEFKINGRKNQIYRNCVHPGIGKYVLECALNNKI